MKTRSRLDIYTIAMVLIASLFLLNVSSFVRVYAAPEAQPSGSATPAPAPAPDTTPATQPDPKLPPILAVSVTDVYRIGQKDLPSDAPARTTVAIGDDLEFKVENLTQLVNDSQCQDINSVPIAGCQPKEIRLFLDGIMIPGIKADNLGLKENTVKFHLERNKEGGENAPNVEQWKKLLSTPLVARDFFQRKMEASIGLENGIQVPGKSIELVRVQQWMFWVWLLLLAVLLTALIILAKKTDILRDQGAAPPAEGERKPYSLAKCQAAFWFFLTITSFCFIFMIMSSFDSLTEGVLGLLGISAGTAVGAAAIDKSAQTSAQKKLEDTQTEQDQVSNDVSQLEVERATLAPPETGTGPKKAAALVMEPLHAMRAEGLKRQYDTKVMRMQVLKQRQEVLTDAVLPRASQGFRKDILSDEQGSIGFHRLQLVAWTLVLGGIFVFTVWRSLSMPDFSAMLVTLQGISGATYLGLKFPESQV